jgi:hypothetical protein
VTPGFTSVEVDGTRVLVNNGPRDDAAGVFADADSPDALWTRQVLTTGRLTALAFAGELADFVAVHELAERVAAGLGIGAIEVGVVSGATDTDVVLTDEALDAAALGRRLAALPPSRLKIMLASGAAG